jgi:hypothetical protein
MANRSGEQHPRLRASGRLTFGPLAKAFAFRHALLPGLSRFAVCRSLFRFNSNQEPETWETT